MKYTILAIMMALTLAACGQQVENLPPTPEKDAAVSAAQSEFVDREKTAEVEAGEKTVPVSLYVGEGYSIYVPSEGWTLELDHDDGIPHQTWEADREDDAQISVYHYKDMSFVVARDRFMGDCGYVFTDGLGGEVGDPLTGTDNDGDTCGLMVAEGSHGTTYVIAWEYPAGTEGTYAELLEALANTFELTE